MNTNIKSYRPRLHGLIDEILDYPVISVIAGSGYGKTQLFDTYFQLNSKNAIWLKMNRLDNLPDHFWRRFIQGISAQNKAFTYELLQMGFPYSPADLEQVISILKKTVHLDNKLYLTLDDLHLVTEPVILEFIQKITAADIPGLHIITLSTQPTQLDLEPLQRENKLADLSQKDLTFTKTEIIEFMAEQNIQLQPEEIDDIYEFTEGWTLAVNLITIALKNGKNFSSYEKELRSVVFDLMEKEMFENYQDDVQKALVVGALFDVYPLDFISALCGFSRERILIHANSNTFLRYNATNDTLSIHYLYLEFLKTKEYLLTQQEKLSFYQNAADWYSGHNYTHEALDCCKKAGLYEELWKQITEHKNRRLYGRTADYFINLLEEMPENSKQKRPEAYLYHAHFLINNIRLPEAQKLLIETKQRFCSRSKESRCRELLGEISIMLGLIEFFQNKPGFDSYFLDAEKLLPAGSSMFDQQYPIIDINRGFTCNSTKKSDLESMISSYEKGFPAFTKITNGCGKGLVELAKAEYLYYKADLEPAKRFTASAIDLAASQKQTNIMLNAYFLMIRIDTALGNIDDALDYFSMMQNYQFKDIASKSQHSFYDVGLSWFYLKMNDTEKVAKWILDQNKTWTELPPMSAGTNHTVRIHWMILSRVDPDEILPYLDNVISLFKRLNMPISLVHIYMLKGFVHYGIGDVPEGIRSFETAYEIIADGGLDMLFIEIADATCEVLTFMKSIPNIKIPTEWIDKIIEKARIHDLHQKHLIEAYYKRELDKPSQHS